MLFESPVIGRTLYPTICYQLTTDQRMSHLRFLTMLTLGAVLGFGIPHTGTAQQGTAFAPIVLDVPMVDWNKATLAPLRPNVQELRMFELEERLQQSDRGRLGQNVFVGAVVGLAVGFLAGWAADAAFEPGLSDLEFDYLYRVTGAGLGLVLGTVGGFVYTQRR